MEYWKLECKSSSGGDRGLGRLVGVITFGWTEWLFKISVRVFSSQETAGEKVQVGESPCPFSVNFK